MTCACCLALLGACTGDEDNEPPIHIEPDDFDGWRPAPGSTWHWQLTGAIATGVDVQMYDIDLFDVPDTTFEALHADGRIVICYFSAGSREDWRDDAGQFEADDYGRQLDGWDGERWLDVRSENVRRIMEARLDLAASRGCDGVEPDNVDGYANNTGFDLSQADQIDFNVFLARAAHERSLSVGLKNAVDITSTLEPAFDWALNEECLAYDECSTEHVFLDAGKAVFHVEYVDQRSEGEALRGEVCGQASIAGFSTLIKTWELDAWFLDCG